MITDKILPAHIIRLYIWALLQQEGVLETISVGGVELVPIIPIEDEPKVADSGKPYAIYGYAENESRQLEQIREGVLSLRVIAPKFSQVGHITNTVSRAFESSDVATEAVNIFSSDFSSQSLEGIRFTHLKTIHVEGGEPADSEAGPVDAMVTIAFRYINFLPTPVLNTNRNKLWS